MHTWLSKLIGSSETTDLKGRSFLVALFSLSALAALAAAFTTPWKVIALIALAATTILTFYRPHLVTVFLAVYIPFEPFLLKFVPDEIYLYSRYFSEGIIYLLLAVVAARIFLQGNKRVATPLDLPFIGFLLVAGASLLLNQVEMSIGLLGLRQIIRFMLLFFAIVNLDFDKRFAKVLTTAMLAVMVFQAGLGIMQAGFGGAMDEFLIPSERKFYESIQLTSGTNQFWSPGTRVFATMGRYDQLGTFLCFFMLIAVGIYYARRGKGDAWKMLMLAVFAAPALVLTLSRASWFGFLGGLFIIGGILMRDYRIRIAYGLAVLSAFVYIGWSGLTVRYLIDTPDQTMVERLFEAFSYERWRGEYYGLGRLYWIVQTVKVVVPSSPFLGVGPGQYGGGAAAALGNTTVYDNLGLPFGVYGTDGYIDNNWFAVWGETGTLGLVFYFWMMLELVKIGYRTFMKAKPILLRGLALGYVGAVAAVTFQAFLATYLEVRTLALYLWLFGAVIFVWAKNEGIFEE